MKKFLVISLIPVLVFAQPADTLQQANPQGYMYDLGISIEPTRESVPPDGNIGVANSGSVRLQDPLDSLILAFQYYRAETNMKINSLARQNDSLARVIAKLERKVFLSPHAAISQPVPMYSRENGEHFIKKGNDAYFHKNYKVAIDYFQKAVNSEVSPAQKGDAYYMIGDSFIREHDLLMALEYLKKVAEFPLSDKSADALFLSAATYQSLGNAAMAEEFYQRLIQKFPNTKLAKLAELKVHSLAGNLDG